MNSFKILCTVDGKCGICGEPYDLPKDYEKGGKLYRGFSVRTYTEGQWIQSKIEVEKEIYNIKILLKTI